MIINPRTVLVDIAREELGIRETSKNQGPGIAKYWPATSYPEGYKNREPYCAAYACWLIMEAMARGYALGLTSSTRPREAAVRYFVSWARQATSGALIFGPSNGLYFPEPGDLVYYQFTAAHPDHIGIVEDFTGSYLKTIEANTDGSGGRDGDGVYRRTRIQSSAKGFIRLAWKAKKA